MSPVEFKKRPCRPVEFKGQGPHGSYIDKINMLSSAGEDPGEWGCWGHNPL